MIPNFNYNQSVREALCQSLDAKGKANLDLRTFCKQRVSGLALSQKLPFLTIQSFEVYSDVHLLNRKYLPYWMFYSVTECVAEVIGAKTQIVFLEMVFCGTRRGEITFA